MNKIYGLLICFGILFMVPIQNVSSLSIVVHVPEKYTNVNSGERFYFEIEVKYPENPKRKDLRLEYEILDSEGGLVAQTKALKAVETQASFIDFIVIPDNVKSGLYLINVKITDYESLTQEVSSSFNVSGSQVSEFVIYFIILLIAIMLIGILVVFQLRKLKKKRR